MLLVFKMADTTNKNLFQSPTNIAELIRGEFAELKTSFKEELLEHIADMLEPFSENFDNLSVSLPKTSQKADKALEISTAFQSEIQTLHLGEDIIHERLVILDHA